MSSHSANPHPDAPTIIQPRTGLGALNLTELWQARELAWVLALRDVQVRYKQTVLGVAWAILQPLAMMIIATLVIGNLLGVADRVEGSYAVFVYAAMVPWTLFAASVTAASNSLVNNAEMLRKIYFPRLIVPIAGVGAPLVDFAASFVLLIAFMLFMGLTLSPTIILLPLLTISALIAALGVGVALAAITVTYRDFRMIVPFLIQLWFFLTPVIYPIPLPEKYAWLMNFNPMFGVIEGFRSVIQNTPFNYTAYLTSTTVALVMLGLAVPYFARAQRRFADVV